VPRPDAGVQRRPWATRPAWMGWLPGGAGRRRGAHADVAGDLDALVAADRGDQVAQMLQAERRIEAVPAGRDAGVDAGGRRRHGGQLQPEDPGVVADMGPSKRTGPRRPWRGPHPADIVEPMLGQRGRGRPSKHEVVAEAGDALDQQAAVVARRAAPASGP